MWDGEWGMIGDLKKKESGGVLLNYSQQGLGKS